MGRLGKDGEGDVLLEESIKVRLKGVATGKKKFTHKATDFGIISQHFRAKKVYIQLKSRCHSGSYD